MLRVSSLRQVALFHDGIELFAHFRAGFDLITEEIAWRQVGEPVLGDNLVALGTLAASGTSQDPNDGKTSLGQRGFVNVLPFQSLQNKRIWRYWPWSRWLQIQRSSWICWPWLFVQDDAITGKSPRLLTSATASSTSSFCSNARLYSLLAFFLTLLPTSSRRPLCMLSYYRFEILAFKAFWQIRVDLLLGNY